jgi:hypothetical protein
MIEYQPTLEARISGMQLKSVTVLVIVRFNIKYFMNIVKGNVPAYAALATAVTLLTVLRSETFKSSTHVSRYSEDS